MTVSIHLINSITLWAPSHGVDQCITKGDHISYAECLYAPCGNGPPKRYFSFVSRCSAAKSSLKSVVHLKHCSATVIYVYGLSTICPLAHLWIYSWEPERAWTKLVYDMRRSSQDRCSYNEMHWVTEMDWNFSFEWQQNTEICYNGRQVVSKIFASFGSELYPHMNVMSRF